MIRVQDVYHVRGQISDIVHVTPVLTSGQLSKHCGNQFFLKSEHLQGERPIR